MNKLSTFKFRSGGGDRVTDRIAEYHQRVRANSPRQRRLAAQRKALIATHHAIVSEVLGGVVVALIIILFFIL